MSSLRRWLDSDDASQAVLDTLRVARAPLPIDARTLARSRRRLAAMTTVPVAVSAFFWFKSVALGAVLGSAVTVAVVVPHWREVFRHGSSPTPAASSAGKTRPVLSQRASTSAQPVRPHPASTETPAVDSRLATPPSPRTGTPSSAATPPAADLPREIQLLERARRLISVDAKLALTTLGEHQREFEGGVLVLERQFLQVEALVQLGRINEARSLAEALRARAPGSLYDQRLSLLLGEKSE